MKSIITISIAAIDISIENFFIVVFFAFFSLYLGQFFALRITLRQKIAEVTKEKLFA